MFNKDKAITRPRDLIGKRLTYPGAPGSGGIAIVKTMIEADGATYQEGDLIPVNNSFYHTDALEKDKADAATLIFENFEIIEAKLRGLNVDFFALKDYNVPDFCQLILITLLHNTSKYSTINYHVLSLSLKSYRLYSSTFG